MIENAVKPLTISSKNVLSNDLRWGKQILKKLKFCQQGRTTFKCKSEKMKTQGRACKKYLFQKEEKCCSE
jgi:hypothetical protein